jgi:hypothetical protein
VACRVQLEQLQVRADSEEAGYIRKMALESIL